MAEAMTNIEAVMAEIGDFNATLTGGQAFIEEYEDSLNAIGPIDSLAQEAINISKTDVAYLDVEGRYEYTRDVDVEYARKN